MLKPCPFCGNKAIILNTEQRIDRTQYTWFGRVLCDRCFGQITSHGFHLTQKDAEKVVTNAWNRRYCEWKEDI